MHVNGRWINMPGLQHGRQYDLSVELLPEYRRLFREHGIPIWEKGGAAESARRIVMVSTHGYWGDPPPAGVPDTGGQTYYVLEVSKAWARQGRQVVIVARHFSPYPRVEQYADNLWLVRVRAGGDGFVRKEDIYPLAPQMAEGVVAVADLFGADAVMGHYADGMVCALEAAEQLEIPLVVIPHSLGINKVLSLGLDPDDPAVWFDKQYNFRIREDFELAALRGADFEIANTLQEPHILKEYYGAEFPHAVMPAGAGTPFFDIAADPCRKTLNEHGLAPQRYLLYFGRFSEAKNVPGVARLYGEARRIAPELMKEVRLVLVGGSPDNHLPEEAGVEEQLSCALSEYGLSTAEVVRLPSQPWPVLATLAHHSLCYVGMQFVEPFGMGVAESMAAGAPVMISGNAGITRWMEDGVNALVVDPGDPHSAAQRLIDALAVPGTLERIAAGGNHLARDTFRWDAIGRRQADILDELCSRGAGSRGRAYHRTTFTWRGDPPRVEPHHTRTARILLPYVCDKVEDMRPANMRAVVVLAGESGAGKTEVAEYLRYLLRSRGMRGVTVSGDAFFRLGPEANHRARLDAYAQGELDAYLGPEEVDIERLDAVLKQATNRAVDEIFVPSDCRRLASRCYPQVPLSLRGADVVLVDLTYGMALKNVVLKVFLETDYRARIATVKARNLERDPDQDFAFVEKVLEIEHGIIEGMKEVADLVLTETREGRPNGTASGVG
ncbi:MAG: glycosyltransferase [Actinobacteria bacterium]|nr:glycosyltransferase [Actinomycetota bacterium]